MKLRLESKMGSIQWANKTGGKLRLIDKLEIARQSFIASRLSKKRIIDLNKLKFVDINSITLPGTLAVKSVADMLEELSSTEITMHSYRTFYWGVLLAKANRVPFDSEQLLIAALAHDLGLSQQVKISDDEHCFTVTSTRLVNKQLSALNYPREKLANISEAITRHINPLVPIKSGVEAHLLNAGALLDVIGSRKNEIDQAVIDDVLILHPRMNFKSHICHCFCQQRKLHPFSRIALLTDNGLNSLIRRAPFLS